MASESLKPEIEPVGDQVFTAAEAAVYLKVGYETVLDWCNNGVKGVRLRHTRLGGRSNGRIRIKQSWCDQFVDELEHNPGGSVQ